MVSSWSGLAVKTYLEVSRHGGVARAVQTAGIRQTAGPRRGGAAWTKTSRASATAAAGAAADAAPAGAAEAGHLAAGCRRPPPQQRPRRSH